MTANIPNKVTSSTVGQVEQSIDSSKEKALKLIGKTLVNIGTSPTILGGGLVGGTAVLIAKCFGGDPAAMGRLGSQIGFGVVGTVTVVPLIAITFTALTMIIKKHLGKTSDDSGPTSSKVWNNSCVILDKLFPANLDNLGKSGSSSKLPASATLSSSNPLKHKDAANAIINSILSISSRTKDATTGISEVSTRQRLIINPKLIGVKQYQVVPRGASSAKKSLENVVSRLNLDLERTSEGLDFILSNNDSVDQKLEELDDLKKSLQSINQWAKTAINSPKLKGKRKENLQNIVNEINLKTNTALEKIDQLKVKRFEQLATAISGATTNQDFKNRVNQTLAQIKAAKAEFHAKTGEADLGEFRSYMSGITRSVKTLKVEAEGIFAKVKEMNTFIASSRDSAVSVRVDEKLIATNQALREYVDERINKVVIPSLESLATLDENVDALVRASKKPFQPLTEQEVISGSKPEEESSEQGQQRVQFLHERYGIADVMVEQKPVDANVAQVMDKVLTESSAFMKGSVQLQTSMSSLLEQSSNANVGSTRAVPSQREMSPRDILRRNLAPSEDANPLSLDTREKIAQDVQGAIFAPPPDPDKKPTDTTENPSLGTRVEVAFSEVKSAFSAIRQLIAKQKIKPDPKFREKIALSLLHVVENGNAVESILGVAGDPVQKLVEFQNGMEVASKRYQYLKNTVNQLEKITKHKATSFLNPLNVGRNRRIAAMTTSQAHEIELMTTQLKMQGKSLEEKPVDQLRQLESFMREAIRVKDGNASDLPNIVRDRQRDIDSYPLAVELRDQMHKGILEIQTDLLELGFEDLKETLKLGRPSKTEGAPLHYVFSNPLINKTVKIDSPSDAAVLDYSLNVYMKELDSLAKAINKISSSLSEMRDIGRSGGWSYHIDTVAEEKRTVISSKVESAFRTELNISELGIKKLAANIENPSIGKEDEI